MAEVTSKVDKVAKLADPMESSIDASTQEMLRRAQRLNVETVFDRAVTMKPCAIGMQGICCKNCAMGPCRLPLPKDGIQGEDTRKGLCGATANTICARNFIRMIAGGAAAHSDHGRNVAITFLAAARGETHDYKIKDPIKLMQIAPYFGVATTVEVDGVVKDRDIKEIAIAVGEKAVAEWGKTSGTVDYLKRAPQPLQDKWAEAGVLPRNVDREIVEIMHRTHMGVDQDFRNLMKQGTRAALADGTGGPAAAQHLSVPPSLVGALDTQEVVTADKQRIGA